MSLIVAGVYSHKALGGEKEKLRNRGLEVNTHEARDSFLQLAQDGVLAFWLTNAYMKRDWAFHRFSGRFQLIQKIKSV